jgi:hypothetical protein
MKACDGSYEDMNGSLVFFRPSRLERRLKPRVEAYFPVRIRGLDAAGNPFDQEAVLANLSASGLYVRLNRLLRVNTPLFAVFSLANLKVATRCTVSRIEEQPNGFWGLGVRFKSYRLLP